MNKWDIFEKRVAKAFEKDGYQVEMMEKNNRDFDLKLIKGGDVGVVQVKYWNKKVDAAALKKFAGFVGSHEGRNFKFRYFVARKGFSAPARLYVTENPKFKIKLFTLDDEGAFTDYYNKLLYHENKAIQLKKRIKKQFHLGVFACKGGVGKSIISAHLAGALALNKLDVAIIDLDPERNLSTLLGPSGIYLKEQNAAINVFKSDEWLDDPDYDFIIYDCSPHFQNNPRHLLEKLEIGIIPFNISPLSINRKAKVILDTIRNMRAVNKKVKMFTILNNYKSDSKLKSLLKTYETMLSPLTKHSFFNYIDPLKEASIRAHNLLYYWGTQAFTTGKVQLAFGSKNSHPKEDFMKLADYLLNKIK